MFRLVAFSFLAKSVKILYIIDWVVQPACATYQESDFNQLIITSRGGAAVARWAHNPEVAGSIPAPATTLASYRYTGYNSFMVLLI